MILGYEIMKNDGEDCSLSRLHCSRDCVAPGRKRYRWRLLDLPDIASPSKSPVTLYARKCSSFPSGRPVGTRSVSGKSETMIITRTHSAATALTNPDWRAASITFQ